MAENIATEDIPLINAKKRKRKFTCPRFSWKEIKERKLKLRTFILVLCIASTTMTSCFGGILVPSIATLPEGPSCVYPVPDTIPYSTPITPFILNQFVIAVMFLFTSWLADTIIGRGKAVRLGLWCCWLGSVLYIVSFCIQFEFCGLPANIAKYGISVLALILITFGNAISWANIPPYGQDQLVNKSSNQIRAFIHWVIWGLYLGFIFDFMYFIPGIIYQPVTVLTTGMVIFLFNSIVLILFGTFHHKFKPSGVLKKNPYKSVYEVLKYAVQHKSPTNRSSMTYWEHTAPSRIDLGKKKYGGPFTEDEVEDVKVFWRIFGILMSTFGLQFPIFATLLGIFRYMNTFYGANNYNNYGLYFFWAIFDQSNLIIIPVIHFIIIPLVPKIDYFLVKSLRNIGALYVLMTISIISLIIISLVEKTSIYWFAIPLFFSGLVGSLRFIFSLEFIISQSPTNMSGMLMSVSWSLQAIFLSFGSFVQLPFSDTNFWVFLINLLVIIVGFVVYIVCAWKYKRRQRDDGYYYQNVIEDTYGRILDREEINSREEATINHDFQTFEIYDN